MKKIYRFIKEQVLCIIKKIFNLLQPSLKPYYIIMVDGGLGSQIFKYALGCTLHQKTGYKIFYDLTWFRLNGRDINGSQNRSFILTSVFPLIKITEPSGFRLFFTKKCNSYSPEFPHIVDNSIFTKKNVYLDAYYSHIDYFNMCRETLLSKLIFSDTIINAVSKLKQDISTHENSVAVHIRLGDYIGSIHDVVTPEYFLKAINYLYHLNQPDTYFYFFCTDKTYVEKNLVSHISIPIHYSIISGTDESGHFDMYRMSLCKHFIISNSSFSLIPAWMSEKNGIVVMPTHWYKKNDFKWTTGSESSFIFKGAVLI